MNNRIDKRTPVGYWRGYDDPNLPDPRDHVDALWDAGERAAVVTYLRSAPILIRWRGESECRICGVGNGTVCVGDAAYNWPEGFAHYVEVHDVRPPPEFVAHVLSTGRASG